jgi:hypothetical protein
MASPDRPPRPGVPRPVFIPDVSDFEASARQQLGDLGTGRDGFDAMFAVPAGAIDADVASLATFDVDVAAAEFDAGDFATVYHAPVDAELPGFLADGEALNTDVQNPKPADGGPVLTPAGGPPGSGAGTGDSGGGGGGGDTGKTDGGGYIYDPCFGDPYCDAAGGFEG